MSSHTLLSTVIILLRIYEMSQDYIDWPTFLVAKCVLAFTVSCFHLPDRTATARFWMPCCIWGRSDTLGGFISTRAYFQKVCSLGREKATTPEHKHKEKCHWLVFSTVITLSKVTDWYLVNGSHCLKSLTSIQYSDHTVLFHYKLVFSTVIWLSYLTNWFSTVIKKSNVTDWCSLQWSHCLTSEWSDQIV